MELRGAHEADHTFGHSLVVERVLNGVAGGGALNIHRHVEVNGQGLGGAPFPLPDADDAIDLEIVQVNDVHGRQGTRYKMYRTSNRMHH